MHAAHVFAPGRIQETIPGALCIGFMLNNTVRAKIITGSLFTLQNLFPQSYRYHYRLEIRMNSFNTITVTVLASAVTPSFPSIPNYHPESHLN